MNMRHNGKLEKLLRLDKKTALNLFVAETAAVLLHDAASFFLKKNEPVSFLLAAFIFPGWLLLALLARAFAAAQARGR
jgi:hypothetical protein